MPRLPSVPRCGQPVSMMFIATVVPEGVGACESPDALLQISEDSSGNAAVSCASIEVNECAARCAIPHAMLWSESRRQ